MEIADALALIKTFRTGTLAVHRPDGSSHLSIVSGAVVGDEIWISLTQDRKKVEYLRHDPRASFLVGSGPWAAIDGTATLHDGTDGTDGAGGDGDVLERLRTQYRTIAGEHPDWDEFDAAMIADRRLVAVITPVRAYGFLPG